jgi:hypothetical protein
VNVTNTSPAAAEESAFTLVRDGHSNNEAAVAFVAPDTDACTIEMPAALPSKVSKRRRLCGSVALPQWRKQQHDPSKHRTQQHGLRRP